MKYIKLFVYFLAATFIFSSCSKQLNQNDPQQFSDANAFRSIDDVQLGVNGAFGRYAAYVSDIYKNSLVADEVKPGATNGGTGALAYRYQYSADNAEMTTGYYDYYSLIDQVNRILPNIPTVTGGTPARKDELKAYLLGLRALAHFGLLQAFSKNYNPGGLGIGIMTTFDPLGQPKRSTMEEVMTQIDLDLTTARSLLPATTASNFSDTVLNQINIAAYQARIALYKRDYDAAITFSSEVINSGIKPLANGTDYEDIWTDASNSESLFRTRFTNASMGNLYLGGGYSSVFSPSDKLTNSYDPDDIRLNTFIALNSNGDRIVAKYAFSFDRGPLIVDLKACRTSEMYLIRAEAYAKKSTPDIAAGSADLNMLRANRIAGYVDENFASASSLVDAVLQERFKELCFEGFRFYDLRRNDLPVERDASDASPAWQTLPANSHLFVFPIPQSAILSNPNTIQNDGY